MDVTAISYHPETGSCWGDLREAGQGQADPGHRRATVLTCNTCSLPPGAEEIWYLLELLRSPSVLIQRTSGLGSPQTTARKMAFFPAARRGRWGDRQGGGGLTVYFPEILIHGITPALEISTASSWKGTRAWSPGLRTHNVSGKLQFAGIQKQHRPGFGMQRSGLPVGKMRLDCPW